MTENAQPAGKPQDQKRDLDREDDRQVPKPYTRSGTPRGRQDQSHPEDKE